MASLLTEIQRNLIEKIAENNGFKDWTTEEYSTTSKGDNYLAQLVCVTIKNKDKLLDVIVKKAPEDADFRKVLPVREIFYHETYMYDTVFTTYKKFQDDMGLKTPFNSYAKFYGKNDEDLNECLVLENLVKTGYSVWNRRLPMTADHIAIVMAEYGKFHAVSYAMREKDKELFDKISSVLKKPTTDWELQSIKIFIKNTSETITNALKGNSTLESVYPRLMEDIEEYIIEVFSKQSDDMVITHGDCWCNNMLFKYEDSANPGKPTKVCLIDWQLSRYGLPVADIIYFFVASSTKEILYDYKKYLKIYHDSLSQNLRGMSCDPDEIFTFERLESLWKKAGRYGMLIGAFISKVLYIESDKQETSEETQNMKSMDDFYSQFDVLGDEDKINTRIVDLFNFMIENDFV